MYTDTLEKLGMPVITMKAQIITAGGSGNQNVAPTVTCRLGALQGRQMLRDLRTSPYFNSKSLPSIEVCVRLHSKVA